MAIRRMTGKEKFESGAPNIEVVTDYPGHVAGTISHRQTCPHFARLNGSTGYACTEMRPEGLYDDCVRGWEAAGGPCSGPSEPLYMETTHMGLVLELRERNGYDDSDFYAVVWNPEKGCTESVEYATTRGWSYPNGAAVDATPETLAAYEAYLEAGRRAADARRAAESLKRAEDDAKLPRKGRRVRVVKGRKTPIGFEGVVIWEGEDKWGKARIGIKNELDGKVEFTAASNAVVDGWEYFLPAGHPAAKVAGKGR